MRLANSVFLCAILILAVTLPCEADQPENLTLNNYDPSTTQWSKGNLAITLAKNGESVVQIDFYISKGKLKSFVAKAKGWNIDLSDLVSTLEEPYPTRTQAYIEKMSDDGTVDEVALIMPFRSAEDVCQDMRMHIVGGRLIESNVYAATGEQCVP
jgi:hypothetical protein